MISSIRVKLFWIVSIMIMMFIGLSFIMNIFFLQKYYIEKNRQLFIELFNQYDRLQIINEQQMQNETDKLERLSGAKVFISTYNYTIKNKGNSASTNIFEYMNAYRIDNTGSKFFISALPVYRDIVRMIEKRDKTKKSNLIAEGVYEDKRIKLKLFVMVFLTKNNEYFIINKPTNSIEDGARIANSFLLVTSIIIFMAGLVFAAIISKKITAPIVVIDDMLVSISKLDFSKRYYGNAEDEIGRLGQNVNFISDELKKNIENLKEANEKLSIEVAKKEKIDEMRKAFISDVSHELKTPISLVRCYAEGLKFGVVDTKDECDEYYSVILDEADKMGTLVTTLLEISEMDTGNAKLELENTNLFQMVFDRMGKYRPVFFDKGIEMKIDISKEINITCDVFKIGQVLENYICNAVNHAGGEIKKIAVSAYEENGMIKTVVFNTGKNIPAEISNEIWGDFYKADTARTRNYGGAGLGLAIVRRIVELHNGNYGFTNVADGVEFWFELRK